MAEKLKEILPLTLHNHAEQIFNEEFEEFMPFHQLKDEIINYKGHIANHIFKLDSIKYIENEFEYQKGDIIVASFPKTGTNLTMAIVRRIITTTHPELRNIFKRLPLTTFSFEVSGPTKFKIFEELEMKRRLFTTHLSPDLLPLIKMRKKGVKIIYISRNVKDQAVSWFKYYKNLADFKTKQMEYFYNLSWDKYLKSYTSGEFPLGMRTGEWYPEHLMAWWEHHNDDNIMFITFEEIIKDMSAVITRISFFINEPLTTQQVNDIAQFCSFKSMKERQEKNFFQKSVNLIRKGGIGGWKNYFTVAQSEDIEEEVDSRMEGYPHLAQFKAKL